MSITDEQAKALREPFPPSAVGKLPRVWCGRCRDAIKQRRQHCDDHRRVKCRECSNNITDAHLHLDYIGHAAVTDRLLRVDPGWSWEPMAFDPAGLPALDSHGGLWIRLTVCGVTRIGYGHADGKTGGDAVKEAIGDCLVRGTPVVTARGTVPIEDVRVGDMVPTRKGWRPVTDHWLSSENASAVAVLLADGRVLVGTPHHRVPTLTGPKRMGALRNADMLYSWRGTDGSPAATRSSGTAAGTDDSQITRTATGASTTWPRPSLGTTCTATSTSPLTAPSPTDGTSITSTTTRATTIPPTSWPFPRNPMRSTTASGSPWSRGSARNAAASTVPPAAGRGGVLLPASSGGDVAMVSPTSSPGRGTWQSRGTAMSAAPSSSPASPGRGSALVPVVAVADAGPAEVWNLSVGDVHEYVANGVYVHNSLRNAAMRFGVALELWHKGELPHDDEPAAPAATPSPGDPRPAEPVAQLEQDTVAAARAVLGNLAKARQIPVEAVADAYHAITKTEITAETDPARIRKFIAHLDADGGRGWAELASGAAVNGVPA